MSCPDFEDDKKLLPEKYVGYRVFSKWIASDQAFCIVRRFGALNMRAILALQDEIVALEEELDGMDKNHSSKEMPDGVENGSFRNDTHSERSKLIREKLIPKLERYSKVHRYVETL
jgi:hypothetical protein